MEQLPEKEDTSTYELEHLLSGNLSLELVSAYAGDRLLTDQLPDSGAELGKGSFR